MMRFRSCKALTSSTLALLALVLSGCGILASDDTSAPTVAERERARDLAIVEGIPQASRDAAQDCLLVIWDEQAAPNRDFDRANDSVEGGAISCATGTTATEFEAALSAIRAAAAANDRAALVRELDIPLVYIDNQGNRRQVPEDELIEAGFDEIFSSEILTIMQNLRLEDMTVVPDQGAFFQLGSLWLVADRTGGRPRLVTVNSQALSESIDAAREAADDPRAGEQLSRNSFDR